MDIKNNFSSIIGLGYFNPAILTPSFLKDVCNLDFKEKPQGQTTPVVANIIYGNLRFIVSLEKLEIRENNIEDFSKTMIVRSLESYLNILKYTPVLVCGINFNLNITNCDINNVGSIIKNNDLMKKILNTNLITIDKKEMLKDNEVIWQIYNFIYPSADDTIYRLNIKRNGKGITVNYNYEVRNIQKDINRIKILGKQLKNILLEKDKLIKKIFMGG